MITAIPKEQISENRDLQKDYKGITRERLVGMEKSVAERLILDSCILDEIERDIDRLDGVAIRRLIRKRTKYMYKKLDMAEEREKIRTSVGAEALKRSDTI